jgi:hypothetical protein
VTGEINDEAIELAASLCARYSDAKKILEVPTEVRRGSRTLALRVSPADNEIIKALRIEKKTVGKVPTI